MAVSLQPAKRALAALAMMGLALPGLAQTTVTQTRDSQLALGKISQEVGAIIAMNAQIASVSVQQSAAAEEVAQNVTRIHSSTVQSAAGSEQVENSNHELAELADRLSIKVAFFNVA